MHNAVLWNDLKLYRVLFRIGFLMQIKVSVFNLIACTLAFDVPADKTNEILICSNNSVLFVVFQNIKLSGVERLFTSQPMQTKKFPRECLST